MQATRCARSCNRPCFPSRPVLGAFSLLLLHLRENQERKTHGEKSGFQYFCKRPGSLPKATSAHRPVYPSRARASMCRNLHTDASYLGGFQLFLLASREQSAPASRTPLHRGRPCWMSARTCREGVHILLSRCPSPAITVMAGVSLPGLAPPENVKPFPNWTCCSRAA